MRHELKHIYDLTFCPACSPHARPLCVGEVCVCGAENDGTAFREKCAQIEQAVRDEALA
jgi:hypothetical protein